MSSDFRNALAFEVYRRSFSILLSLDISQQPAREGIVMAPRSANPFSTIADIMPEAISAAEAAVPSPSSIYSDFFFLIAKRLSIIISQAAIIPMATGILRRGFGLKNSMVLSLAGFMSTAASLFSILSSTFAYA